MIESTETIVLPEIQTMTEYIRRHYENEIFTELERRLRCGKLGAMCEGRLLRNPDRAIQTSPLVPNLLPKKGSIVWANYRRIAECCVQAELTVELEIEITRENSRQTVRQRYDVDMWFDMEGKIAGEYGGFRLHRCRNEKPGVKLDEYLVPDIDNIKTITLEVHCNHHFDTRKRLYPLMHPLNTGDASPSIRALDQATLHFMDNCRVVFSFTKKEISTRQGQYLFLFL